VNRRLPRLQARALQNKCSKLEAASCLVAGVGIINWGSGIIEQLSSQGHGIIEQLSFSCKLYCLLVNVNDRE
jgi:hypothetical protein